MILDKVSKKKEWTYKYDFKEEMEGHIQVMLQAGFELENYDYVELKATLSQTITELNYDDIEYKTIT